MTIDPDAPITLERACEIVFAGEITPATLRAEARRGRLTIERIGRKDFVTLNAISEMRKLCRVESRPAPSGSRPMVGGISPQEALRMKLERLRNG